MLDSDLAKLYGIETKRINEAVKNNLIKFLERFSFTLSESETLNCLMSKISTSKIFIVVDEGIYQEFLQNKVLQCLQLY